MEQIVKKKIILWVLLSLNLLAAFFIGLTTLSIDVLIGILFSCVIIPILAVFIYLLLGFFKIDSGNINFKRKKAIWAMLSLNMLFSYLIGATIPLMESKMWIRYNMAFVMLPLLIILNYIIFDRYHFYLKHVNEGETDVKEKSLKNERKEDVPVIEYEGKKYIFSIQSIALLAIGAPVLSFGIYLFFDNQMNFWLHEIVVKHTVFFLNLLFNMNVEARYHPGGTYHWSYVIPGRGEIYFEEKLDYLNCFTLSASIKCYEDAFSNEKDYEIVNYYLENDLSIFKEESFNKQNKDDINKFNVIEKIIRQYFDISGTN